MSAAAAVVAAQNVRGVLQPAEMVRSHRAAGGVLLVLLLFALERPHPHENASTRPQTLFKSGTSRQLDNEPVVFVPPKRILDSDAMFAA